MSKAGLFLAVVTTFVAQTYQHLQVEYAPRSESLLFDLVLVQRAITDGSLINTIRPFFPQSQYSLRACHHGRLVNGLWFTSLFLSLTTALVAVLTKQWLHHYVVLPRDHSVTRIRWFPKMACSGYHRTSSCSHASGFQTRYFSPD